MAIDEFRGVDPEVVMLLWLLSADSLSGAILMLRGSHHGGVMYGCCFSSVFRLILMFRSIRASITFRGVFSQTWFQF